MSWLDGNGDNSMKPPLPKEEVERLESLSEGGRRLHLRALSRTFSLGEYAGLVGRFAKAAAKHVAAGCPRPPEFVIAQRMEICKACPEWRDGKCGLCGCSLKAKTAWALEACPADPPRWEKWSECAAKESGAVENLDHLGLGEVVVSVPSV